MSQLQDGLERIRTQAVLVGLVRHAHQSCNKCYRTGYAIFDIYEPLDISPKQKMQGISPAELALDVFDKVHEEQQRCGGPVLHASLPLCRACLTSLLEIMLGTRHIAEMMQQFDQDNIRIAFYRRRLRPLRLVAMTTRLVTAREIWGQRYVVEECRGAPGDGFYFLQQE